jgi:hypothetical protein
MLLCVLDSNVVIVILLVFSNIRVALMLDDGEFSSGTSATRGSRPKRADTYRRRCSTTTYVALHLLDGSNPRKY